jgi:ankyrin repeat protein
MSPEPTVRDLIDAIASGDLAGAVRLLDAAPHLGCGQLAAGARREEATEHFLPTLGRYLYEGDTPLHVAAAAWRTDLLRRLIAGGADPMARNRMGSTPLHAAASGDPASARWDPAAQAKAIEVLVAAGADPNAADNNGSTPLHKAVRTRCAAAVEALLKLGADPGIRTRNGSTPETLAQVTSGRGGSGSPQAKAQQTSIVELLSAYPAKPK